MEVTTALLGVIIALTSVVLYFLNNSLNYWKKRGVPHDKPTFFYGNMKGLGKKRHFIEILRKIYTKYKGTGPFCGLYFFYNPVALILELELVKKILIKDFSNFSDRGVYYNEKDDPLSAHLFNIEGEKWRTLRNSFSPTFSSGKMKFMFPIVADVGHRFVQVFGDLIGTQGSVMEVKDINARFTTDVIGTCAFGIDCNSLIDPNAHFRTYGRKVFETQRHNSLIMFFIQSCPSLARKLGVKVITNDVEEFFMGAVKDTIAYREKNNIKRNDFMGTLIDLKNQESSTNKKGLSIEVLSAQAFVFYLGGFETSSSTMSYAFYELARHPEVQDRLRSEINEVLAKTNGELTYESLWEMTYMGQVIAEILRMYPIVTWLQRVAKDDYETGDPRYKIEKGTLIFIPADAIHYDPDLYPNPDKFDPERFTAEEQQKRESVAWLPFGDGPRNCIGARFGKMQTRIGLALMIKNFKFSVCKETQVPLKFDIRHAILQTADGIYLKAERV